MLTARRLLLAAAVVTSLIFFLTTSWSKNSSSGRRKISSTTSANQTFPRKIWQTWKEPAQGLEEELQRFARTWINLNPDYRYEILTDESALTYVREKFEHRQDIVHVFEESDSKIFRADFIRYLVMLAEGGVYTDIDTHCTKPINTWIPSRYLDSASLVVGLEFDAQGGKIRDDFILPVSLSQWTFMAKPGHGAMAHVVDRVTETLQRWRRVSQSASLPTMKEVLDTTGPAIFTRAIFEYLSAREGRTVSFAEISNIVEPKLMGDVLFLPISAFASGQTHSGSKPWDNPEQLLSHHWRGSWLKSTA